MGQGEALGHDRSALQSMDSLAAPQDAAADQAGHNGPAPAPEPEPVPEGRLPGQEAAEGLPQASPAIARFRAPVHPSDRPKLESFDQKIGKQPNAVQAGSPARHCMPGDLQHRTLVGAAGRPHGRSRQP